MLSVNIDSSPCELDSQLTNLNEGQIVCVTGQHRASVKAVVQVVVKNAGAAVEVFIIFTHYIVILTHKNRFLIKSVYD